MKLLFTLMFAFLSCFLFSQNNILGGNLTTRQIGGCTSKTVETTIIVYVQGELPPQAFQINWGDSTSEPFEFQQGEPLNDEFARYQTTIRHTYSGPGQYAIFAEACCLVNDYINLDGADLSFLPQAIMVVSEDYLQGCDDHPSILQPAIGYSYAGQNFNFNPFAFDPDGDSLSYQLMMPTVGSNYRFPDEIEPGMENNLSLNATTGDLTWEVPQKPGDYFVLLEIEQFRNQLPRGKSQYWLTFRIKENGLLVYPNPTFGDLFIELENSESSELSLRIFNPIGQLIAKEQGNFDLNRYPLTISYLANGVYLLEIVTDNGKWVRKVVKQ
jgi:hypothetical protein